MGIANISDNELRDFLEKNWHYIFHTIDYNNFIKETLDIRTSCIAVKVDNEIKLILPLHCIRSPFFGNRLISTAFLEYGGFAGDEKYIPEMISYLKRIKGVDYIEIKQGLQFTCNLPYSDKYKRFVLMLKDEKTNWEMLDRQKRKAIRKAEKFLDVREIADTSFYDTYLKTVREFGTPPFSKKYFENFFKCGLGKCFGAFFNRKLVCALLGFCYDKKVHITILATDKNYLEYRPNELVHWHFIKWAIANNYREMDFGIVRPEQGNFRFKKEFGCELLDLKNYYILFKGNQIPDIDPHNEKYRFIIRI